jgi:hypothetical protein
LIRLKSLNLELELLRLNRALLFNFHSCKGALVSCTQLGIVEHHSARPVNVLNVSGNASRRSLANRSIAQKQIAPNTMMLRTPIKKKRAARCSARTPQAA